MATRTPTIEYYYSGDSDRPGNPNVARVVWTGLLNGDTGAPVCLPEFPDKTVQISGTFGASGSITMQGSNDKPSETPTYLALTDPQGNPVTKGAAAMETFEEATALV